MTCTEARGSQRAAASAWEGSMPTITSAHSSSSSESSRERCSLRSSPCASATATPGPEAGRPGEGEGARGGARQRRQAPGAALRPPEHFGHRTPARVAGTHEENVHPTPPRPAGDSSSRSTSRAGSAPSRSTSTFSAPARTSVDGTESGRSPASSQPPAPPSSVIDASTARASRRVRAGTPPVTLRLVEVMSPPARSSSLRTTGWASTRTATPAALPSSRTSVSGPGQYASASRRAASRPARVRHGITNRPPAGRQPDERAPPPGPSASRCGRRPRHPDVHPGRTPLTSGAPPARPRPAFAPPAPVPPHPSPTVRDSPAPPHSYQHTPPGSISVPVTPTPTCPPRSTRSQPSTGRRRDRAGW